MSWTISKRVQSDALHFPRFEKMPRHAFDIGLPSCVGAHTGVRYACNTRRRRQSSGEPYPVRTSEPAVDRSHQCAARRSAARPGVSGMYGTFVPT